MKNLRGINSNGEMLKQILSYIIFGARKAWKSILTKTTLPLIYRMHESILLLETITIFFLLERSMHSFHILLFFGKSRFSVEQKSVIIFSWNHSWQRVSIPLMSWWERSLRLSLKYPRLSGNLSDWARKKNIFKFTKHLRFKSFCHLGINILIFRTFNVSHNLWDVSET